MSNDNSKIDQSYCCPIDKKVSRRVLDDGLHSTDLFAALLLLYLLAT